MHESTANVTEVFVLKYQSKLADKYIVETSVLLLLDSCNLVYFLLVYFKVIFVAKSREHAKQLVSRSTRFVSLSFWPPSWISPEHGLELEKVNR